MHLATIRVRDTHVLSLALARLDGRSGSALIDLVSAASESGARDVVIDLHPATVVDFAGARALRSASAQLPEGGRLFLAGLNGRARAVLRSHCAADRIRLIEWWTEAMEPLADAA